MDFITELPEAEGYDQLWIIVDRFTKMVHFIPLLKKGKTTSDLVKVFAGKVWRLHGLPSDIVWDWNPHFTSDIWKDFLALLVIRHWMSTEFRPQTDGQTDRLHQMIEVCLRAFINHEQNDWVCLIPNAEFAYNNSITTATGLSPFYANYGFHPTATNPAAVNGPLNPASKVYAHWMYTIHESAAKALLRAQERMKHYADQHRKDIPVYQTGDLVMLNGKNIQTRRPSRKLDHKNHGPFQVEKIVSPLAVKLTLPRKWKIHNVFHVSLLEPFRASKQRTLVDPDKILREADDIKNNKLYDVDEIMGSTQKDRRVLYLVRWRDYPDRKHWTNEPYDNFSTNGQHLLREFHRKNPEAPRDYRLTND